MPLSDSLHLSRPPTATMVPMNPAPGNSFATLFASAKLQKCKPGQILASPFADQRGVFLLTEGYLKAYDITEEGETQLISYYGPGDIFPLYWAVKGGEQSYYHQALVPVSFKMVSRQLFTEALQNDGGLVHYALDRLLELFQAYQLRIKNLELPAAEEKLAFRLLFLADYFGIAEGDAVQIAIPLPYQDLADSVRLTRDTVSRIMSHFIKQQIVYRKRKHVLVVEPERLRAITRA